MTLPLVRRLVASTAAAILVAAAAGAAPPPLAWAVAAPGAVDVTGRRLGEPVNPASVVKVGTALWALDRLGAGHRFSTRFGWTGNLDPAAGVVAGELWVLGGGDPDFQAENALLVARALNDLGVREIAGDLVTAGDFWIGWEGGSARRLEDPEERSRTMAVRLRAAWDPSAWTPEVRSAWEALARRRGWTVEQPPAIRIRGNARGAADHPPASELHRAIAHRSSPLAMILRRFLTFSNNDIERFRATLGGADGLEAWLGSRLGSSPDEIRLATLSGLGKNRMTPRTIVALLRAFDRETREQGLVPGDLLPRSGCGPSTLRNYPALGAPARVGSVVAKTGTLTSVDGGTAVLAGYAATAGGEVLFAVAAPGAGARLAATREAQSQWLTELAAGYGGLRPGTCGPDLPLSDHAAAVEPWPMAARSREPGLAPVVGEGEPAAHRAAPEARARGLGIASGLALAALLAWLLGRLVRRRR